MNKNIIDRQSPTEMKKLLKAMNNEEQQKQKLMDALKGLSQMMQQAYDDLTHNDKNEVNNQAQLRQYLIKTRRGITHLTNIIVQLKTDQAVLQRLIKDVNLLKLRPSIRQKALVDYLHDFTVTDTKLEIMNRRQKSLNNQANQWHQKFLKAIQENKIVFDQSTVFELAACIRTYTGKSLQGYIGAVKQSTVNQDLEKLFQPLLEKSHQAIQIQSKLKSNQNELCQEFDQHVNDMDKIAIIIGILSLSSIVSISSTWLKNLEEHPWITSIITLINVSIILWMFLGGKNHD